MNTRNVLKIALKLFFDGLLVYVICVLVYLKITLNGCYGFGDDCHSSELRDYTEQYCGERIDYLGVLEVVTPEGVGNTNCAALIIFSKNKMRTWIYTNSINKTMISYKEERSHFALTQEIYEEIKRKVHLAKEVDEFLVSHIVSPEDI